jgi:cation transport regulator ChaC
VFQFQNKMFSATQGGRDDALVIVTHGLTMRILLMSYFQWSPQTFDAVWKREMGTGAYLPSWLTCATSQGAVTAMAFVIDRRGPAYVTQPPEDDLVEIICRAHGTYGSCFDYVTQTAVSLKAAGICDEHLATLTERLLHWRQDHIHGQSPQQRPQPSP